MCLRFVFLLITRLAAWLRLSRRDEIWKTAEILILRHQLAVLQRRQPRHPKLNWADRALLAALPGMIPNTRRHGLRLPVTPDTIVRWHRDIVRRRCATRSIRGGTGRAGEPGEHQGAGPPAGPGKPRIRLPQDPPGKLAGLGAKVAPSTVWGSSRSTAAAPRRSGPGRLAAAPALPGRGDPGMRLQRRPARRHPRRHCCIKRLRGHEAADLPAYVHSAAVAPLRRRPGRLSGSLGAYADEKSSCRMITRSLNATAAEQDGWGVDRRRPTRHR